MPFRILTVCTGNICRSPQAEQLLRKGFADAGVDNIEVSSAGTMALVGEPMPEHAAALSREFGGDPSGHRARQLTKEMVEQQDLILAMAREHRGTVAKLSPRASLKTFTLLEYARILDGLGELASELLEGSTHQQILALARERRGYYGASSDADDVVDPYQHSDATYRRSAEQIAPAARTVVETVTPSPDGTKKGNALGLLPGTRATRSTTNTDRP
jgi:protein-tyrosine phosphatase